MADTFCPVCKNKNTSDAANCAYCGVPLGAESQSPITTVPLTEVQPELLLKRSEHMQHLAEYPRDSLILYVMDMDQPVVVPGLRPVVLGRVVTNVPPGLVDLSPYGAADLGVSRQHAQISYSGTYSLVDMGSTNGTWLNQARLIARKPYALRSGDEVRLGSLRLMIYYHQDLGSGSSVEEVILLTEGPSASAQRSRLTMTYLTEVIQPYLAALVELQKAIDQFQGLQPRDVTISTISAMRSDLPLGISLGGAAHAVSLVKTLVNPWRTEYVADLSLYLYGRLPTSPDEPLPTAVDGQQTIIFQSVETSQAARQAAIENLRAKLPRLAQAAADHLTIVLASEQKGLADRLLPSLTVLATSRLQMVLDKTPVGV